MTEPRSALRPALPRLAPAAPALLVLAAVALGAAALQIRNGEAPVAGALVVAAAVSLGLGIAAAQASRRAFVRYAGALADAVGDTPILAVLAWLLRASPPRIAALPVAAIGCVFLGAYAEVKAGALGFRAGRLPVSAPERLAVVGVGLLAPRVLEPALWAVALLGLAAAARSIAGVLRTR